MESGETVSSAASDLAFAIQACALPGGARRVRMDGMHMCVHSPMSTGNFDSQSLSLSMPDVVALAQIMTRMQLNWCGEQKGPAAASSTFKHVLIIFLAYLGTREVLNAFMRANAPPLPDDDSVTIEISEFSATWWVLYGLSWATEIVFFLYMLVMVIRTRSLIRKKYAIPEDHCTGCEDCCCSWFCSCCAVSQMARHTADYDTYPASCCTTTGLPSNVPGIV